MATKHDNERKSAKAEAVTAKINRIVENGQLAVLIAMLDEWKLDLLLLALGDGEVTIRDD